MKQPKLYYKPPSDELFNHVREEAIKIWRGYDRRHWKAERLRQIKNVPGNFMYIVTMFDPINQRRLSNAISDEANHEIYARLVDGGMPPQYNVFKPKDQ